jgi:hypothetical protein
MPDRGDLPLVAIALVPAWGFLLLALVPWKKGGWMRSARWLLCLPAIAGALGYLFAVVSLCLDPIEPSPTSLGDRTGFAALGRQLGYTIWGQIIGAALIAGGLPVCVGLGPANAVRLRAGAAKPDAQLPE